MDNAAGRERELREAHCLYTEMEATGHAERLAGEWGCPEELAETRWFHLPCFCRSE